jgi:tripartite-type tricarboxylate transporter receptor subunit TctC
MARFHMLVVTAWVMLVVAPATVAQSFPWKPVKLLSPSEVGAPPDLMARAISPFLAQTLGQPFVVENRPGANGIVGMEACAKSAADGHTLCVTAGAHVSLNPFLYSKLPYDPPRDFAPIIRVGTINACIVVNASVPAKSMHELIDLARAKPGAIEWGAWGNGSFSQLYLAWVQHTAGVSFHHVPYKTPGQAANALLSGDVQVLLYTPSRIAPLVKAGKVKAIAITGTQRSADLPGVPSFKEQGLDLDYLGWVGIFAPTGTPRNVIQRLNAEVGRLVADSSFADKFMKPASVDAGGGSPEQFEAFLKADRATSELLVRLANAREE